MVSSGIDRLTRFGWPIKANLPVVSVAAAVPRSGEGRAPGLVLPGSR